MAFEPFNEFDHEYKKVRKWFVRAWIFMAVIGVGALGFVLYLAWLLVTHLISQ